jgi:hypothetical protein
MKKLMAGLFTVSVFIGFNTYAQLTPAAQFDTNHCPGFWAWEN